MLCCVDNNGLLYIFTPLASLKYSWVQTREWPRVTLLLHSGHPRSHGWQACFSSRSPWFNSGQGAEISVVSPRSRSYIFGHNGWKRRYFIACCGRIILPCVSVLHLFSLSSFLLNVGCFTVLVVETRAADIAGVWLSSKILVFLQISPQAWEPNQWKFIHICDFLIYLYCWIIALKFSVGFWLSSCQL